MKSQITSAILAYLVRLPFLAEEQKLRFTSSEDDERYEMDPSSYIEGEHSLETLEYLAGFLAEFGHEFDGDDDFDSIAELLELIEGHPDFDIDEIWSDVQLNSLLVVSPSAAEA